MSILRMINLNGEIFFNMFREPHPVVGRSEFMLKRWRKYTIYEKSGSYVRSNNPSEVSIQSSSILPLKSNPNYAMPDSPKANVYSTNSIYLYDYVIVSDQWIFSTVYTSSAVDSTPAASSSYVGTFNGTASFSHNPNTWINSPNAIYNNYLLRYNPLASTFRGFPVYGLDPGYNPPSVSNTSLFPPPVPPTPPQYPYPPFPPSMTDIEYQASMQTPIYRDDGTYFEIVRGYPRNHYTHKRNKFALERFMSYGLTGNVMIGRTVTSTLYRKGMQTSATTIGLDGLGDGSDPIQSTQVTNIDLIQSDNVIYH